MQKQIERLRDVVATSFGEEGESSRGDNKAGTDVLLPGTGILRDLSDALDRYFDGQMVEDDKAQAHYQWLDTYRQAAESWVVQALGILNLVPGVPE